MSFQDHFSARAGLYARARPDYPATLFDALADRSPGRGVAWDCGTGNGQAALGLARHFSRVIATDPSAAQLARATPHDRITYLQTSESDSRQENGSVALVTAAQAAHWFDLPAFYREADRVLARSGFLALWCYGLCTAGPDVDPLLGEFYSGLVGPYWPPERRHIEDGYRSLPFPYPEEQLPGFTIVRHWTLDELVAYVRSWSAVERFTRAEGRDPVIELEQGLQTTWAAPRTVTWPVATRAGRKP